MYDADDLDTTCCVSMTDLFVRVQKLCFRGAISSAALGWGRRRNGFETTR